MEKHTAIILNRFAVCPRCHHEKILMKSAYAAYKVSDTAWIQAELKNEIHYKLVCPICGHSTPMHLTVRGLEPVGFKGEPTQAPILQDKNVGVGYVEEEK